MKDPAVKEVIPANDEHGIVWFHGGETPPVCCPETWPTIRRTRKNSYLYYTKVDPVKIDPSTGITPAA